MKPGPGTRLKNFLDKWGVTKEWWVDCKQFVGLPPTCDCTYREEWMNEVHAA